MTTVLNSLNTALRRALVSDPNVLLLGEDLIDPYGGAFKVTRGLSTAFPGRVLNTPISEGGIVSAATGMALRGLRPVVEIMFGDFVTLAADALINHAAKFRWMYNDQVRVPMTVRTPSGGRRGYGPTHSQSLEKLFLGVPGLRVQAPAALGDPGKLLEHVILTTEDPVLFVENKLLYLLPVLEREEELDITTLSLEGDQGAGGGASPAYALTIRGAPKATVSLVTYGYMAELARQAVLKLAYEWEVFAELLVLTQLAPCAMDPVLDSARRTGRLLLLEEGGLSLGWGSEIAARAAERLGPDLRAVRRLAGRDLPIPASGPLEAAVLPGVKDIVQYVLECTGTSSQVH